MWSSAVFWLAIALVAACGIALWSGVQLRRARRRYQAAVEQRTWLMERERESAAQVAVDEERARIARELHDIVSHNVSMMLIQAGAARQVLAASAASGTVAPAAAPGSDADSPSASGSASAAGSAAADATDPAADALLAVESAGRATMTELRHLLGVLAPAQDGADDELAPQPTMARLGPLVDRIAFAGLPVEMRISGEPRTLPAGVDATAYRIIQEALTNALKHGRGGTAEVTVRYDDRWLRIEVLSAAMPRVPNPTDRRDIGTGRGLLGLRERVAVYGGDLDARRRLGGGFRVRARIPLDAP